MRDLRTLPVYEKPLRLSPCYRREYCSHHQELCHFAHPEKRAKRIICSRTNVIEIERVVISLKIGKSISRFANKILAITHEYLR